MQHLSDAAKVFNQPPRHLRHFEATWTTSRIKHGLGRFAGGWMLSHWTFGGALAREAVVRDLVRWTGTLASVTVTAHDLTAAYP